MKISELIKELQSFQSKYGDIDVMYEKIQPTRLCTEYPSDLELTFDGEDILYISSSDTKTYNM